MNPLDPPLLTADLPGCGGRVKDAPDDFVVEELPAYEPSGRGEHLYLWLEKRDVGAEYLAKLLARKLGVKPGEIGTAGMKDRRAVTRQWVSVPASAEPRLADVDGDGLRVLNTSRHGNKLRPGHLRGNRFDILIRDPGDPAAAAAVLDRIGRDGLPNYFGPQRFGRDQQTATLGLALVRGEPTERVTPFLRKLALSAAQSVVFNAVLGRRLLDGLFRVVLAGDVLMKRPTGGLFVSSDAAADQVRFDGRAVAHAGPMVGRKTFAAKELAAEREAAALAELGLTAESFHGFGALLDGTRRANVVYPDDLACEPADGGLRLRCTLPAGSYATGLLREVMKSPIASDGAV